MSLFLCVSVEYNNAFRLLRVRVETASVRKNIDDMPTGSCLCVVICLKYLTDVCIDQPV